MTIQMELYELKNLISESVGLGVEKVIKELTPAKDAISQREAYKAYGEARVKAWVRSGLVSRTRNGETSRTKILYSKSELKELATAEKLHTIIKRDFKS